MSRHLPAVAKTAAALALAAATVAFGAAVRRGLGLGRRPARLRRPARPEGSRDGSSAPAGGPGPPGGKPAAAGRLAIEWLEDMAGRALGWSHGDEAADALAVDLADELAHAINDHARRADRGGVTPTGGRPAAARPGAVPARFGPSPSEPPTAGRRRGRALVQASSR